MYFKWIFAILGFYFLGLRGAFSGFFIGFVIDSLVPNKNKQNNSSSNHLNAIAKSLTVLTALVMKADQSLLKSELNYVKSFYLQQFGEETTKNALLYLRSLLKQPTLYSEQACIQLRTLTDYSTRINLLYYFFEIANVDGTINSNELNTIYYISNNLGIAHPDFLKVKEHFIKTASKQSIHWAYTTLEVSPSASNDEIKKAYRRLAVKHHPDKVGHYDEKQQKAAEEHFKKINNAFEEIKRQRDMS